MSTETIHLKPVMDAKGNWSLASYALRRDAKGWHDRPLLTQADLNTNMEKADERRAR